MKNGANFTMSKVSADRKDQTLKKSVKILGKRQIFADANYPYNELDYPNKNAQVACAPDSLIVDSAETIYEAGEHTLEKAPVVSGISD